MTPFEAINITNPKVSWMMVAYYRGRAIGQGWDVDCNDVPDEYRADCKDAYDRGASDYADELETVPFDYIHGMEGILRDIYPLVYKFHNQYDERFTPFYERIRQSLPDLPAHPDTSSFDKEA